jgi:hypothetical protein
LTYQSSVIIKNNTVWYAKKSLFPSRGLRPFGVDSTLKVFTETFNILNSRIVHLVRECETSRPAKPNPARVVAKPVKMICKLIPY